MLRVLCSILVMFGRLVTACPAAAAQEVPPSPPVSTVVVAQNLAPPPVDIYVATYEWLRALPPDQLIRIAWDGTGQADRAISIARRESGLRCDAHNPHSSATGLFQTLSIHAPRAQRLGLKWSDVSGPDCLADVILARAMWADSGWGPWRV